MLTDYGQIKQVISTLEHEFTLSSNPNSRKGGLVGLAATAIALGRVRERGRREGGREGEREEGRGEGRISHIFIPSHIKSPYDTDIDWHEPAWIGTTSLDLLWRPWCSSALLCLWVSLQHLQGGQGGGAGVLQRHIQWTVQGQSVHENLSHCEVHMYMYISMPKDNLLRLTLTMMCIQIIMFLVKRNLFMKLLCTHTHT